MPIVGDRRNPYPPPAEVLYFLIHDEERREKGYKFPSPLGELYFLIFTMILVFFVIAVSVPSRGAIFLNKSCHLHDGKATMVSVPSRGAIFLNQEIAEILRVTDKFPSPLGELYFLISRKCCRNLTAETFPSPLGELYFLIK